MEKDFKSLGYLAKGNHRQQQAYRLLNSSNIFGILEKYNPILVGTVPLKIDIDGSDLDIICRTDNINEFAEFVEEKFSHYRNFRLDISEHVLTAAFLLDDFQVEIYGENKKTTEQNGYRHMMVENRVLELGGDFIREKIISLKKSGLKTEPAFAKLLNLRGNPYNELLKLEHMGDDEILKLLAAAVE